MLEINPVTDEKGVGMGNWNRSLSKVGLTCKGCTERSLACHDRCEKYKRAVAEVNAERLKVKKMKKIEEQWIGYTANKKKGNVI